MFDDFDIWAKKVAYDLTNRISINNMEGMSDLCAKIAGDLGIVIDREDKADVFLYLKERYHGSLYYLYKEIADHHDIEYSTVHKNDRAKERIIRCGDDLIVRHERKIELDTRSIFIEHDSKHGLERILNDMVFDMFGVYPISIDYTVRHPKDCSIYGKLLGIYERYGDLITKLIVEFHNGYERFYLNCEFLTKDLISCGHDGEYTYSGFERKSYKFAYYEYLSKKHPDCKIKQSLLNQIWGYGIKSQLAFAEVLTIYFQYITNKKLNSNGKHTRNTGKHKITACPDI